MRLCERSIETDSIYIYGFPVYCSEHDISLTKRHRRCGCSLVRPGPTKNSSKGDSRPTLVERVFCSATLSGTGYAGWNVRYHGLPAESHLPPAAAFLLFGCASIAFPLRCRQVPSWLCHLSRGCKQHSGNLQSQIEGLITKVRLAGALTDSAARRSLLTTCGTAQYGQCGGLNCPTNSPYQCADTATGCCPDGFSCIRGNAYYWQCLPQSSPSSPAQTTPAGSSPSSPPTASPPPGTSTSPSPPPPPPTLPTPSLSSLNPLSVRAVV